MDTSWEGIGEIEFTQAAASYNGDFVIHFHHPKWRDDPLPVTPKPNLSMSIFDVIRETVERLAIPIGNYGNVIVVPGILVTDLVDADSQQPLWLIPPRLNKLLLNGVLPARTHELLRSAC